MDENEDAYERARQLIHAAIEAGSNELDLSDEDFFHNLVALPPEIAQLTDLESLSVACIGTLDLSLLGGLHGVKKLHLRGVVHAGRGPLPLPELEELTLSTKYAWLPDLLNPSKLRRLTLECTDDRITFADIRSYEGLEALDLRAALFVPENLDFLLRLPAFKQLRAQLDDQQAEGLKPMDHIEVLELGNSKQLTETGLRHFANMPNLRVLDLDGTAVADLTPTLAFASVMANPKVLKELRYASTPAAENDEVLAELCQLEDVELSTRLTLRYLSGLSSRANNANHLPSARDEVVAALDALERAVRHDAESAPSLGHNNPPEPIEPEIFEAVDGGRLEAVVRKLRSQFERENPNLRQVKTGQQYLASARSRVLRVLRRIAKESSEAVVKDASRKVFTVENLWWAITWAWCAIKAWRGQ